MKGGTVDPRRAWLDSLKVGDEVAVGCSFLRVSKRTPKYIFVAGALKFHADRGDGMAGMESLDEPGAVRRLMMLSRLRFMFGSYSDPGCEKVSTETLTAICALLDGGA